MRYRFEDETLENIVEEDASVTLGAIGITSEFEVEINFEGLESRGYVVLSATEFHDMLVKAQDAYRTDPDVADVLDMARTIEDILEG